MAGGPRKFSEKIALLNQKEAEANRAFCSIMDEVSRIRPGSGSQVDLVENFTENKNNSIHSAIDEVIGYNEHVSITYEHQQYQQLLQNQQLNLPSKKSKHQKVKKQDQSLIHIKNELTQPLSQQIFNNSLNHNLTQVAPILSSNSYLQLPNQTDSFRRAHSDSSIHNSIVNQNQSTNYQNNFQQQMPNQQNINQNGSNNIQQQQHVQHLNFSQQQQQQVYQQPQNQYHQANSSNYQNNQSNNFLQQNLNSNSSINTNNNSNSIPFKNTPLPSNPSEQTNSNSILNNNLVKPSSPILPNSPQHNDSLASPTNCPSTSPHQQSNFLINTFKQESAIVTNPGDHNNNFIPMYNVQHLNVHQSQHHQHQQHQQQHQAQYQQPDHLININPNKNLNNNLLNPSNIQNTSGGGSLPDLTSFQFQNNQIHQYQQLVDYNKRLQQQNNQNHEVSSQLLQPNFQQHNYIGPVKPTHNNSVSPTRGMSRYSPTSSSSNINSIANRRPSPQRNLPLGDLANIRSNTVSTTVQSMPSSPHQIPSINSPLPSLEFTINSEQIQTYLSGLSSGVLNSSSNQQTNILNNIIQYRNGGGGITHINGLNGESLPPSPQSQQSCFNSPQGSPGPLSISPQDLNPFTTQNYDIMQKKFDSINLETNHVKFNGNNISPQQHHQSYNNSNNLILASPPHTHNHNSVDNNLSSNNNETNSVNINENLNTTESVESDIGAFVLNSRSDSMSSNSSSSGNQNNDFTEIELQNLNANSFKNNDSNHKNNKNNNNAIKNHKNSIPNIILTYSGDSVEEKNELIIKDLSNDLMYNDDLLIKHENFDLDLQMLSDSPVALDQNFNDDQTVYQSS